MPPADRGGSTSVRGRIRSPHSSGGLQGSCAAYSLWRSWHRRSAYASWDRRTDGSTASKICFKSLAKIWSNQRLHNLSISQISLLKIHSQLFLRFVLLTNRQTVMKTESLPKMVHILIKHTRCSLQHGNIEWNKMKLNKNLLLKRERQYCIGVSAIANVHRVHLSWSQHWRRRHQQPATNHYTPKNHFQILSKNATISALSFCCDVTGA